MRSKLHWIALFAFVASLVLNAVVFGALVATPGVGPGVRAAAHFASPIAWVYVSLGDVVMLVPGAHALGDALVASAWAPLFDRIREAPQIALDILIGGDGNGVTTLLAANYWATPVLLVVWVVCWTLRPKSVHLVRTRGR